MLTHAHTHTHSHRHEWKYLQNEADLVRNRMPWIAVVTSERSPPGNRNTSSRMTGWKSQKWSVAESLKGEGIPARNDPSESPSQAVILIIIHFDRTKVVFFVQSSSTQRKKNPTNGHQKYGERKLKCHWYLFIYFLLYPSLSLSHC